MTDDKAKYNIKVISKNVSGSARKIMGLED